MLTQITSALLIAVSLLIPPNMADSIKPSNDPFTMLAQIHTYINKQVKAPVDSRYIIHAGGVTPGGATGSNSLEAMDYTYERGYRAIEVDFSWTEDGYLACVHDWDAYYAGQLGKDILTLEEYESLRRSYGYTSMTVEDLAQWMVHHPDTVIITDIKENCVAGAQLLADSYPYLKDRFWIQIYGKDEYEPVSDMGYKNIILTVYQMTWEEKSKPADLVAFAKTHPLVGLTFPVELIDLVPGYLDSLLAADIPLYVHTINDAQTQTAMLESGVAGVYTDIGQAQDSAV